MKDTSNYGAGTLELLLVNAFTARSFVNKNGGMIPTGGGRASTNYLTVCLASCYLRSYIAREEPCDSHSCSQNHVIPI